MSEGRSRLAPCPSASARRPSTYGTSPPILRATTNGCWRSSMGIEVRKPGLSTTVQDLGREGSYTVGLPTSGALDLFSLIAANLLVGNPERAAGLECAYMGPELVFSDPATLAVTGAEFEARVNGRARPGWTSFDVEAGDVVTFGHLKGGARLYIAVSGGIDVPEKLGSRSTYGLGALGGLHGRPLEAGDELPVGSDAAAPAGARDSRDHGPLRPSADRPWPFDVPGDDVEAHSSGRPHRLPLQRRETRDARARAALWGRQRSFEHRRRAVPRRLDPGPRRGGANCAAPRRGVGRRIRNDRHRHQRRHGHRGAIGSRFADALFARGPRRSSNGPP